MDIPLSIKLLLASCLIASGCTVDQLKRSTVHQASTLTDLQYGQVLNNLAFLSQDPYALPYHVSLKTGSTQISDTGTAGINFDLTKFSGTVPSLTGSRAIVDQWGTVPITDESALRLLRIAYQRALGRESRLSVDEVNDLAHTLSAQIGTNSDISIYGEIFRFVLEDTIVTQRSVAMPAQQAAETMKPEDGQKPGELLPLPLEGSPLSDTPANRKRLEEAAGEKVKRAEILLDVFGDSINQHFISTLENGLYIDDPTSPHGYKLNGAKPKVPVGDRKPTGLAREADRQVQDILGTLEKIPRGWFHVGTWRDVPRDACYKGRCGNTWAWVCPDGRDDLAEFSLAILKLASAFKDPQLVTAPSGIQFSPALAGQR